MKKVIITTDSAADLPKELIEKYDIGVIPYVVILDNESLLDGISISTQDIFDFVSKTDKLPKTAAPGIDTFSEFFKNNLKKGDEVLHINISSELSAGNQNAKLAAKEVANVTVVDSRSLSSGIALAVLHACEMANEGKSAKEIADEINAITPKIQASFVVDSLDYLHKGGRCSGMAVFGANLLRLHPMLLLVDGKIKVHQKFRGSMDKIFEKYALSLREQFPNVDKRFAFVTHSGSEARVIENIVKIAKEKFGFENVYINVAGSTITSHCGKNTLGLLFVSKENVSED